MQSPGAGLGASDGHPAERGGGGREQASQIKINPKEPWPGQSNVQSGDVEMLTEGWLINHAIYDQGSRGVDVENHEHQI